MSDKNEEKHEKKCTGWWIPIYVVELFQSKEINKGELLLLATIHSLSKTDEGCFASNKYLGGQIGTGESQVCEMIGHMKKLNLIQQVKFDGRSRWLEVYYARNPNHEPQKTGSLPAGKPVVCLPENRQSEDLSVYTIRQEDHKLSLSGLSSPDGPRSFDGSDAAKKKRTSTAPTKFDRRVVEELYKVIATKIKINSRADRRRWADQIRLMRTKDKVPKQDIRRAVQWYADHIHDDYAVEAYSAETFRKKYANGKIPGAMARGGGARRAGGVDLDAVRSRLFGEHDFQTPTQGLLDEVLVEMGHAPGSVKAYQV